MQEELTLCVDCGAAQPAEHVCDGGEWLAAHVVAHTDDAGNWLPEHAAAVSS